MRLRLLDEEHGLDPDGVLWVRVASGWRRAEEPPDRGRLEVPTLYLHCPVHDWHRLPPGVVAVSLYHWTSGRVLLTLNGQVWTGGWQILFP